MALASAASTTPCLAVFDLDGTLTWRDTLLPYLAGFAWRHPTRMLGLWRLPLSLVGYACGHRDRGRLKAALIRTVMGDESRATVDAWSAAFVEDLERRGSFRPAGLARLDAHRAAGDHLVLLSASPDLYVPRIGRLLRMERTVCTEIKWQAAGGGDRLVGDLVTPNRRGEEKSRCLERLREEFPGLSVTAYGNSSSDLPHLTQANCGWLVNGDANTRRAASEAGLVVAEWH